jgi:hypothetical protein
MVVKTTTQGMDAFDTDNLQRDLIVRFGWSTAGSGKLFRCAPRIEPNLAKGKAAASGAPNAGVGDCEAGRSGRQTLVGFSGIGYDTSPACGLPS